MRLVDADALMEISFSVTITGEDNAIKIKRLMEQYNKAIINAPTIDAEPVKHGEWVKAKWIDINDWTTWRECSCCGEALPKNIKGYGRKEFWYFRYCPNCGAKMDKE